jgi:hypothetical protein
MIYFVGSLLRERVGGEGPPMTARVTVRPTDTYPADGEQWSDILRTAPLFRVAEVERSEPGSHAAEVTYRGNRYVAGPVSNLICVGADTCNNRPGPQNDASARVLSLLTQLVIIAQSEEAQLAPRNLISQ